MSLFVTSLNSGSNGNCYYVGNGSEAVLIDAGISCRETEKRMSNLKLNMQLVKAIFISHEHTDHIRGVATLSKKYNLPVYITQATLKKSHFFLNKESVIHFSATEPISVGSLTITPFAKHHDAIDPYSFIVEGNGVKVGVITDIGKACEQVVHYFKQCHAAFLEANYDEQMLEEGNYPVHLKKRIRGDSGHLSNAQALKLFTNNKPAFMSHLFLSHLSKENNCPDVVYKLFSTHAGKTNVVIASRYNETGVYQINGLASNAAHVKQATKRRNIFQMSLFEEM
jgi:phosphoribosyl 1,2-cyclic phosphodiesterase